MLPYLGYLFAGGALEEALAKWTDLRGNSIVLVSLALPGQGTARQRETLDD